MSELERLRRRCSELEHLLESGSNIAQDMRLSSVLNRVVQHAVEMVGSEAGTLWLADEQQYLSPVVIIGGANREQLSRMRLGPGEGVAGRVFSSGQPLLIQDVHSHPRWARRFDSATGFRTNSLICTPLMARGRRLGSLQIVNKAGGGFFQEDDLHLLMALANQASLIIDVSLMLQHYNNMVNSMAEAVAGALDARSIHQAGHAAKVTEYSLLIGQQVGLSPDDTEKLRRAALLHDIGKLTISEQICYQATLLTPAEVAVMNGHANAGAEIVGKMRPTPAFAEIQQGVRHHHERFDGTGFPGKLAGEAIPLFARIIAVADTFWNLTSDRPNRQALSPQEAIGELIHQSQNSLDPQLVQAFITAYRRQNPLVQ